MADYIGLLVGANTDRVYAVINPDHDHELENPRHLLIQNEEKEPVRLIKVARGDYHNTLTFKDVQELADRHIRRMSGAE